MVGLTLQRTLNIFLSQPCCICIEEVDFELKGSETDATGILPQHTGIFSKSSGHKGINMIERARVSVYNNPCPMGFDARKHYIWLFL